MAREMNRTADAHARQKKHIRQRVHDSATGYLNLLEDQIHRPGYMDRRIIMPNSNFKRFMSASVPEAWNEANAMTTRAARAHKNKISCKINKAKWTPDNRRLVTGTATGEFTFWDGMTFQFETIYRTHGTEAMPLAVRAMEWSHNARWLISSDVEGNIKYWSHQWEPSNAFVAHERSACRDLSFSPTDAKFASCGDDKTVRVWDFATFKEEQCMQQHTYDVQSVDWHPFSSLIASGSRDKTVKLWDPRQGKQMHEFTDHSQQVSAVQWNLNGQWLLTTSRDKSVRLYDLRTLKELQLFNCSELSHASSIGWHPFHERVFASGHYDGRLCFWRVGEDAPTAVVQSAHDQDIATLDWHPNGHALATAGMDTFTKVWIRQRPGDSTKQYTTQ